MKVRSRLGIFVPQVSSIFLILMILGFTLPSRAERITMFWCEPTAGNPMSNFRVQANYWPEASTIEQNAMVGIYKKDDPSFQKIFFTKYNRTKVNIQYVEKNLHLEINETIFEHGRYSAGHVKAQFSNLKMDAKLSCVYQDYETGPVHP